MICSRFVMKILLTHIPGYLLFVDISTNYLLNTFMQEMEI